MKVYVRIEAFWDVMLCHCWLVPTCRRNVNYSLNMVLLPRRPEAPETVLKTSDRSFLYMIIETYRNFMT